jgi:hypothetical protein
LIAAIYARKSTQQSGVADEAKSVTRQTDGQLRLPPSGVAQRLGPLPSAPLASVAPKETAPRNGSPEPLEASSMDGNNRRSLTLGARTHNDHDGSTRSTMQAQGFSCQEADLLRLGRASEQGAFSRLHFDRGPLAWNVRARGAIRGRDDGVRVEARRRRRNSTRRDTPRTSTTCRDYPVRWVAGRPGMQQSGQAHSRARGTG